jgi:hypothetical protein
VQAGVIDPTKVVRTPGIQRDLRHKELEAVQTVLEVLERRRAAARKIVHTDHLSAATKPR